MPEYISVFDSQGYDSVQEVMKLSWEDFEDIGVKRLGHLKRLGLAIKKLKVRPLTDISPCQNWSSMQFVPQYQQRGVPPFLTRELVFHLASGIYLDAYRQQCKTTERKTFILVFFFGEGEKTLPCAVGMRRSMLRSTRCVISSWSAARLEKADWV